MKYIHKEAMLILSICLGTTIAFIAGAYGVLYHSPLILFGILTISAIIQGLTLSSFKKLIIKEQTQKEEEVKG